MKLAARRGLTMVTSFSADSLTSSLAGSSSYSEAYCEPYCGTHSSAYCGTHSSAYCPAYSERLAENGHEGCSLPPDESVDVCGPLFDS